MKLRNNQKIGINSTLWTLSGVALVACGGGGGGGSSSGSIGAGGSVRGGPAITLNGELIRGTPDQDSGPSIDGTARNDFIVSYAGDNDIDARGGDDLVYASGEVDGGPGQDIIFGTRGGNDRLNGGTGNDLLFGEGGEDTIRGGAGDDYVVSGAFASIDDIVDFERDVPLDGTIERTPVNERIELDDDTPDSDSVPSFFSSTALLDEDSVIMQGTSVVYGDAGDDVVLSYTRASRENPNRVFGDGDTPAADDGDDIILAVSNSEITGGRGDDIFYLDVDLNNELFRVLDFGNGDDQFLIIADQPLPSLQDVMNFYDRFDVTLFADSDTISTRIEIRDTTLAGLTFSGTVELIGFIDNLERDDFLVMTEAEAIQLIADTGAGPDVVNAAGLIIDDISVRKTARPAFILNGDVISGVDGDGTARNDFIHAYEGNNDIDARDGDDLVFASGEVDGGPGQDVIFGTLGDGDLNGGTGNDLLGGEGGDDTIRGGAGDDYVVSGAFASDEFADLRHDAGSLGGISSLRISLDDSLELEPPPVSDEDRVITLGTSMLYGDAGDDVVLSYTRASQDNPNRIFGDGDTPAADDGDDIILATSNSEITGGGGDDIFYLEADQNNDLFRILDFGNGEDQFLIIADRPLPSLQDVMNFYDSFDVFPVTAPVEFDETAPFEPFDPHRESDIIGTRLEISGTTLAGVPLSVTVELIGFTRGLERDDFLVMTEAEAIQLIADTDAGPDVLNAVGPIITDII